MFITPAISNLIRLGKLENIFTAIETGKKHGMQDHRAVPLIPL